MKYIFSIIAALMLFAAPAKAQKVGDYFAKVMVSVDTITNTEADTINLGVNLLSNYAYNYIISRTQLSGTANTTVKLQESNELTGSVWYDVATASGTGATVGIIQGANTYGVRHRILITGTGTQNLSYKLTARLKKTN